MLAVIVRSAHSNGQKVTAVIPLIKCIETVKCVTCLVGSVCSFSCHQLLIFFYGIIKKNSNNLGSHVHGNCKTHIL